ncbi:NAD(P)H-binding protein [Frankia nepalensis]|uniref:NAD(P)H-binding protein n=1 Tax=Frankia nepalensis TaxID=1836974 RepID=UPI0027DBA342|nr:NAD(P)H-binding protein [Frankia nepalensis]
MSPDAGPVLVTGAAGGLGGVGRMVVELLVARSVPVRAMAHRDDERAAALRGLGVPVVVGDLTRPDDVARALDGCRRMYFAMSVSPDYLEAAATVATVARATGGLERLVAMSQLTVSQMNPLRTRESHQQRLHWLSEQVLDWSGLPVAHVRPTAFCENPLFLSLAAHSIRRDGTLSLPFGAGRTSPVAARDVARVVAALLADPEAHREHVYELTGPRAQDMSAVAEEYSRALGRTVSYVDVAPDWWSREILPAAGLPPFAQQHLLTLARMHRENRFDRLTRTVEQVTGLPAQTIEAFVAEHRAAFTPVAGRRPVGATPGPGR